MLLRLLLLRALKLPPGRASECSVCEGRRKAAAAAQHSRHSARARARLGAVAAATDVDGTASRTGTEGAMPAAGGAPFLLPAASEAARQQRVRGTYFFLPTLLSAVRPSVSQCTSSENERVCS